MLGSLLPIALGFLIAKTGFGSRSTAHAVDDVTNSFTGAIQNLKNSAVHGKQADRHEQDADELREVTHKEEATNDQPAPAAQNRKFFGIV